MWEGRGLRPVGIKTWFNSYLEKNKRKKERKKEKRSQNLILKCPSPEEIFLMKIRARDTKLIILLDVLVMGPNTLACDLVAWIRLGFYFHHDCKSHGMSNISKHLIV